MKKIRRLLAVILICVFCVGVCPLASAAEPLPGSTDLYLLSENNSDGQAKLLGKTVTVEGIVTVASGVWHDQVNYFSIVTPRDSYRFGGGTLVYSPGNATQYKVGDRVVVTGTVVNGAYASDKGTTAIRTASSSDIQVRGSGVALPDAYPIYTDPLYEEVELDPGLRFEGMPVRVLGKVSDVAAEGTVRGFYVDGSRDGDYEDGAGRMQVKWYSYSGIESQVSQGDWVVVEGILMQSDASSPYTSGYYIRPSSSAGIQLITQDTVLRLSEAVRQKKDGTAALAGLSVTVHGVAAGPTGQWHESNTAFAMVSPRQTPGLDPVYPSGGLYMYGEGIAQPVARGDALTVTGVLGNAGYDGNVSLTPSTLTVTASEQPVLSEKFIYTDWSREQLQGLESTPVKIKGRVTAIKDTGITRTLTVDGSEDGNTTDGTGTMVVKVYSYSGLSLEGITVGEEVVVSGSLQKEAGAAPVGDYFVRPVEQLGIQRCSEHPARTLYVHLDGFRNDYVQREDWDTPVFDALISGGTRCTNAWGEYVSMTTANMTTLCTGAHTGTHQVPALAFYDKVNDRRVRFLQNYDVATVGEMFGSQGLLVGAIKQRKLQNRGADLFAEGGEIAETASQAVQMILHEDPDLMVVLFNETDSTAHKYGTSGPQIQAVVEQIDDALGQILDAYRQRGHAEALNVVLVGDHGMTEVHTNLTSTLSDVLDAVGIPYENAAVNIGPFREDTKLVYNLASGSAEIYFRKPLTQAEYDALIAGLEGITGVARVYTRSELDAMDTPQNLGDLVVDCAEGYAFSTSVAEHGAKAQQQIFMVFNGPTIKQGELYETECRSVDCVANILAVHGVPAEDTVDGAVLNGIYK